jgi:hypothetical protein
MREIPEFSARRWIRAEMATTAGRFWSATPSLRGSRSENSRRFLRFDPYARTDWWWIWEFAWCFKCGSGSAALDWGNFSPDRDLGFALFELVGRWESAAGPFCAVSCRDDDFIYFLITIFPGIFFSNYSVHTSESLTTHAHSSLWIHTQTLPLAHNARTLIPMNTRTQILTLSSKTGSTKSYHWKHKRR